MKESTDRNKQVPLVIEVHKIKGTNPDPIPEPKDFYRKFLVQKPTPNNRPKQ